MKSLFFLCCFALLSATTLENTAAPGDPIPGVDVKLGCKGDERCKHNPKHKPNSTIAAGETDENGGFWFADLPPGNYYVKYGIREKGIKTSDATVQIDGIEWTANIPASGKATQPAPKTITKTIDTEQYGKVDINLTYQGGMVRGSINKSRSNIK